METIKEQNHALLPWNVEGERFFQFEGVQRLGVPVHSKGYEIGVWFDTDWDGDCPDIRFIEYPALYHSSTKGV